MLLFSYLPSSSPLRSRNIVKKMAWKNRFSLPLGGEAGEGDAATRKRPGADPSMCHPASKRRLFA
jgi:hypothetical protein